jgi:hypothetical protein
MRVSEGLLDNNPKIQLFTQISIWKRERGVKGLGATPSTPKVSAPPFPNLDYSIRVNPNIAGTRMVTGFQSIHT